MLGQTPSGPLGPFVAPGTYTVRLKVGSSESERQLQVLLDPRVSMTDEDLSLHTKHSLLAYHGYLDAQKLRDAIDLALTRQSISETQRARLRALRGDGEPRDGDIIYGSIYAAPVERETVVDLQHKLLFLLKILQGADARPTAQAITATGELRETLQGLQARFEAAR